MTIKETFKIVQQACTAYRHAILHGDAKYMDHGLYWYFSNTYPQLQNWAIEQIVDFVEHFGRQSTYVEKRSINDKKVNLNLQYDILYKSRVAYRKTEVLLNTRINEKALHDAVREYEPNQYLR